MSDAGGQRDGGAAGRAGHAYIGSFTSAGGRGVTSAAVDPGGGALRALHHTGSALADPSFLVLGPDGGHLYAVSETEWGRAAALTLGDPERPRLLGEALRVHGASPTHLALGGGRLFTANYGSGSVSSLGVRAGGELAGPAVTYPLEGRGPRADRQAGPHAHAVVPDPSGGWLLVTDLGSDAVWVYALDAVTGLRRHRTTSLRAGTGPRHLAFHPDGHRAYVVHELDPVVTTCSWNAATGILRPLGETPAVPERPGATRPVYPSGIVASADGRHLWVGNRGDDSIAVLTLSDGGDRAELTGSVPCGGHWPRALALHPSGRWLYVANERSGDVTWFELDPGTGTPHRAGALPAPAASCVVFR